MGRMKKHKPRKLARPVPRLDYPMSRPPDYVIQTIEGEVNELMRNGDKAYSKGEALVPCCLCGSLCAKLLVKFAEDDRVEESVTCPRCGYHDCDELGHGSSDDDPFDL